MVFTTTAGNVLATENGIHVPVADLQDVIVDTCSDNDNVHEDDLDNADLNTSYSVRIIDAGLARLFSNYYLAYSHTAGTHKSIRAPPQK